MPRKTVSKVLNNWWLGIWTVKTICRNHLPKPSSTSSIYIYTRQPPSLISGALLKGLGTLSQGGTPPQIFRPPQGPGKQTYETDIRNRKFTETTLILVDKYFDSDVTVYAAHWASEEAHCDILHWNESKKLNVERKLSFLDHRRGLIATYMLSVRWNYCTCEQFWRRYYLIIASSISSGVSIKGWSKLMKSSFKEEVVKKSPGR